MRRVTWIRWEKWFFRNIQRGKSALWEGKGGKVITQVGSQHNTIKTSTQHTGQPEKQAKIDKRQSGAP